jgi:hypothetical protein
VCEMLYSAHLSKHTLRWRAGTIWLATMLIWLLVKIQRTSIPEPIFSSSYLQAQTETPNEFSCDHLQGLDDVFLILRTGANDAPKKLPIHFNTTLLCLPEHSYGIWSDLEEDVGEHHVENALDEMDRSIVANHPDFEYYRSLQENGKSSIEEAWQGAPNTEGGRDTPAWRLDKWKFLPLARKAFRRQPDAKWFIYMECDSYIHWASMLTWLSYLDATKPYYLGQQMQIGNDIFAYGGSTIVISNLAMKAVVDHYTTNLQSYDDLTSSHWAGDCVLGKVMQDAGVELSWLWPTFYSEMPFNMDFNGTFGPVDTRPWCFNAMTYHHASPSDIDQIFRFEHKWNQDVSLTVIKASPN